MIDSYEYQAAFAGWLEKRLICDARGDDLDTLVEAAPRDRFWLGRVASEEAARQAARDERFLRLDPCAIGFTFKPSGPPPWRFNVVATARTWSRDRSTVPPTHRKSPTVSVDIPVEIAAQTRDSFTFGQSELAKAFAAINAPHAARIDIDVSESEGEPTLSVTLVNATEEKQGRDTLLYEAALEARNFRLSPFMLDDLPDSFRYERGVAAWGVNAGIDYADGVLKTVDFVRSDRQRPKYWDDTCGKEPDLGFSSLAADPIPSLRALTDAFADWTDRNWSDNAIDARASDEKWAPEMREQARVEANRAKDEVAELRRGLALIERDAAVRTAFSLMNEAFEHSGARKGYRGWRPFQLGFVLLALPGLVDANDASRQRVDTLWFATGGGKTETYLALVVLLCLLDRIQGKAEGMTAWSRFPLRMLSLQQTQRFADVLAGAELAKRRAGIGGAPLALGYFVGQGTPNKIPYDEADITSANDYRDPAMPARYRLLLNCPFCFEETVTTDFDETAWRLRHVCTNGACSWPDEALPFYVVDDEIYRFLPAVVVGTIDKAAMVGLSASVRGFFGAPLAVCSCAGHGFTYSRRSKTPNGCLVPGCRHQIEALAQDEKLFAPGLRVQDELHLLSDSLGAIDAYYETLLDHLTSTTGASVPKIIGSSATLAGFEAQVEALYKRSGVAFPMPGPRSGNSFWTQSTDRLMRRFVALAPRGQTQEFAADRIAQTLQESVRRLLSEPEVVCAEAGVDPAYASELLDIYGTNVFYGSKLPDVEATARSLESQPPAHPTNVERLTGGTEFSVVRTILDRLGSKMEPDFEDRIHVICASAMMSHGVDIDRFNVMTILGVPLKSSEFIQTSARIGRRYPGLVFVLHRMVYERDAKVFRSFDVFVQHGDRFVEPIAITRKSRNVIAKTIPGALVAQLLQVDEPRRLASGGRPLSTVREVLAYARSVADFRADLIEAVKSGSRVDDVADPIMVRDIVAFVDESLANFRRAKDIEYPPKALNPQPLRSLRDVEATVLIREGIE
jgi:hypothetical protein